MKTILTLNFCLIFGVSIATGQTIGASKDSAMNFLIRGLWIEYEMQKQWNPNADTVILFSLAERNLYYDSKPLTDSLFSLEPKYAEKTAQFFELKTGVKRNKIHRALQMIPVLDKQMILKWTTWYRRNMNLVKSSELDKIMH